MIEETFKEIRMVGFDCYLLFSSCCWKRVLFNFLLQLINRSIFSDNGEKVESTVWQKILGMLLVFVAQGIQAFQTVIGKSIEYFLLFNRRASSSRY